MVWSMWPDVCVFVSGKWEPKIVFFIYILGILQMLLSKATYNNYIGQKKNNPYCLYNKDVRRTKH